MSKQVTKNMSTGPHEVSVVTMTKDGIMRDVEDCERTGSCPGDPRNNVEWHKAKGWKVSNEGQDAD